MAQLQQNLLQPMTCSCISTIIKPLRIFQFFLMLLLFAFTIYIITLDPTPISAFGCIVLIVLSGIYVFILAIELINRFADGAVHVIPMFVFSLVGLFFFGITGILLICGDYVQFASQMVIVMLCVLIAFLFLIDIVMILVFWKQKCSVCRRCCYGDREILLAKETPHADMAVMRFDTMTSVSDIKLSTEGVASCDHSRRRIEHPRRRQYVDCPTCVPSLCNLDVAQIQTDMKKTSVVESQTPKAATKETPVQTLSRCEFCERQMQPFSSTILAGAPAAQCFQHSSHWTPAIVQFVRGGVNMPCCPGCKCSDRRAQPISSTECVTPQPKRSKTEATQQVTKSPKTAIKHCAHSIPKLVDVPQTDVKLDVKSEKTINVYKKPASMQCTTKTDEKPTMKKDTKDPVSKFSIDKALKCKLHIESTASNISVSGNETAISEATRAEKEKLLADKGCIKQVKRKREKEELTRKDDNVKRSKGGGEERDVIYQRFIHTMLREDVEEFKYSVATQVNPKLVTSPSSKTKPKMLHMKTNRVDPLDNANIADENRVSEEIMTSGIKHTGRKDELAESSDSIEHQNVCRCEYWKNSKSMPSSSKYYTTLFTSNIKDAYYCEFCRPYKYSGSISRSFDISELKKLRCASCKFSFYERCSKVCPICLKQRKRLAASPK